ncbi:thiolase family protein [Mycobacterium montefiorense]|uniref:acetyl-CoA C-acyltransferase n=1 Tax=Mycobacterium montefiorense TaxID=154654 RepID=A0AA37PK86_9MYCO|nr:thiolase family protein [Mycobacterium montefiorense]GBG40174.1 acetyl-CoA acetyltransferase [Mycobacterium montefiorense]GKU35301.1 acetyl-CoA acetyltransferase [Mycobacterium montefiorense]GKU40255.1 acetyl-CoA acetyltransferase [Mycobacterium montefiorense]GKU46194.1 acetyl-CoA acetyltransferase [Mycobacterium montefiorense]GKU53066.1 acetyl-CoA acetyltransferase [Mycobacterium montefiorense]
MPEADIVSALRTPIGTARTGTLGDTSAFDLAHHVVSEAATDLDPAQVDDVILGEGLYGGGVVARHAAITAGLSHVPGLANNRHCAAGQAAMQSAAASMRAGMDAWALRSHRNAIAAIDEGRFKEEIVAIETPHGLLSVDEHPRRDTTMEKLAALKPLHPEIEGFSITAGNACGANDGAAALVIASDRLGAQLGLPALATVRSWASVGVDPAITGLAPVAAIPKALARAGISISDVDLFEINEAFAAMCVATIKMLELDPEKVNVSGSGSGRGLGHPVAATGARMLVTLVHELRRHGGGIGVAAMCAGGGMGSATVIEVPAP